LAARLLNSASSACFILWAKRFLKKGRFARVLYFVYSASRAHWLTGRRRAHRPSFMIDSASGLASTELRVSRPSEAVVEAARCRHPGPISVHLETD